MNISETIRQIADRRQAQGQRLRAELKELEGHSYLRLLRERARRWPGRPAVAHQGRSLTYGQLFDAVDHARAQLLARGVREQQAVALLMHNSDHYLVWYLAVLGIGAVAVPLNNRLVAAELDYVLRHSQSVLLLSEAAFGEVVEQLHAAHDLALPTLRIKVQHPPLAEPLIEPLPEPAVDARTRAAIYYTSGTTGRPKGVVHSHATLIADALQSPGTWEYDHPQARLLAVTPLFHIAAHTCFFPVLFEGGALHIDSYGTERTLELLRRDRITALFAVPSILLLLIEKARTQGLVLDEVKTVCFGAAPMTISRLGEVQALFPNASLVHGMGQTESGGTLVTLPGVLSTSRAGSVGLPMAGVEVAIVDAEDRELPRGTVGELVARGPNVMRGYLRDESATAATLRGGWLHTGDLGWQSEEGLVTLVDRKKDMIIRGGENIYSSEVEQALLSHPRVKAAAVVGQPDPLFGEQVCAFLCADPQHPTPTGDEMLAHCASLLADYKLPACIHFIDAMPQTSTGKIQKAELRARLLAKDHDHA